MLCSLTFHAFSHSFGYDSHRRSNLKLLDETTLMFIAGNLLVLLDVSTKQQRYLRSCKVNQALISQSFLPFKLFDAQAAVWTSSGGTKCEFSCVDFNLDGSLLASVGGVPDYRLTLWNWRQEEVMQSCKGISQEVYRVSFSPYDPERLTSSGSGHIK
ncbi:hypothetical protein GOODEAATRI_033903 [Goodea atripinnis]|uniref:Uncharacterized protein n=1 Tax=Goodea atripinnis TaxID=208336 RepID=A0ABV0PTT1_9TELE